VSAESPLRDGDGAGFDLIETMRWQPGMGFARFDRHLARLCASAATLGFACDAQHIGAVLDRATSGAGAVMRVRLVLSRSGEASAAAQPYEPIAADRVWQLRLAHTTLQSHDRLLSHKTTRRQRYNDARSEYRGKEADEVLLANERGEICEGTITNVFADLGDGVLATPRLECGLLPGVLRAELLDEGRAREAIYSLDELKSAKALFVGNSLRGLIPAKLT
jgi:4-amino-4-deoxychorismate lyase